MSADRGVRGGVSMRSGRWFYPAASLVIMVLMIWGFKDYYFHGQSYPGRPTPPPIKTLVIIHGVAMTVWVLLLTAQTLLVRTGQYRFHRMLGMAGAMLAGVIVASGWMLAIKAAVITPPDVTPWGFPADQFLAVPVSALGLYTLFVAAGLLMRNRPEVHRNCMLLGTVSALAAAVSRIDPLNHLYVGTAWEAWFGPFLMTAVLGLFLLALKTALTRSFDRILAAGCLVYAAAVILTVQLAPSRAWTTLAGWMMGS